MQYMFSFAGNINASSRKLTCPCDACSAAIFTTIKIMVVAMPDRAVNMATPRRLTLVL
jgi:hypothetical protein